MNFVFEHKAQSNTKFIFFILLYNFLYKPKFNFFKRIMDKKSQNNKLLMPDIIRVATYREAKWLSAIFFDSASQNYVFWLETEI